MIMDDFNFMSASGINLWLGDSKLSLTLGIGIMVVFMILVVLFCASLFSTMQSIPKESRKFPSWFVWLMLLPGIGIVFQWIMLPFGIPNSIKKASHTNRSVVHRTHTLFGYGLVLAIISTMIGSHHTLALIVNANDDVILHIKGLLAVVGMVFFALYWINVVSIRKKHLD